MNKTKKAKNCLKALKLSERWKKTFVEHKLKMAFALIYFCESETNFKFTNFFDS